MDILSPLAESPFNTTTTATTNESSTDSAAATTTTAAATGGLRRKNTLKAYLANKNKLKERQAINVIVDPSVLAREDSSGSEHETEKTPFSPISPTNLMSPASGKRIDTDLETLDDEKKAIEDQLAAITQQLNGKSPSSSAPSSPTGATSTTAGATATGGSPFEAVDEAALIEKRTRLCAELDSIIKRRRELLQSWARDYKNLKRSGSLAKRQEDLFWVTTA
ncbi:hypothetical protein BGZ95_006793 [Linnemannia exigua]|uniref:Uncharacterized protein n=1 Tax=Linnemannia exigua TaxID=604196 RepID=A0AAD4DG60_9FUNG|nr:hypothetical protein BGZ95_006793 [Linnemannia exigua]